MDSQNPVMYKEQIIEKYIPLVKYLASRISIGKTKYIEYEDLVSYGIIGLMDAISKFDPTKGMKFSSYASIRIRGSMIDEIRKNRPISKGAMDKLARYNESIERLQNRFMREPTMDEIAIDLNMTISEVSEIENYINYMSVVSLETIIYSDDDDVSFIGIVEDKTTVSPESSLEEKEKLEILAECIEKLKEKDRLVLNLYYFEGLNLREIGDVLGVSESRICQLHSRAIRNLRVIMEKVKYI
ncbi:MAG: FliA/WhiG family RNA polymerase sigma factor [Clostridium sp.]